MKTFLRLLLAIFIVWPATQASAQITCTAGFTTTLTPNVGTLLFTNTSTWTPVNPNYTHSFLWNFGDGNFSTDSSGFSHAFAQAGTYNVCLYLTTGYAGTTLCTDTFCQNVTVSNSACAGLSAVWTLNGSSGTIISVTAADTNTINTVHTWNWGDGTSTTGGVHVYHTYTTSGTYNVCQYIEIPGTGCVDSSCHTVTVNNGCGNAVASFTVTSNTPAVILTSTSTGVGTNTLYQWWMDGQIVGQQSTNSTLTISNVASGTHNFCLYIYANANTFCDSTCRTETIGTNPCAGLTAYWGYTLSGNTLTYGAYDTVTTNTHHYWNFGDGTTGTGVTGTHTYTSPGVYTVCQYDYIINTNCIDSFCRTITITSSNCAGLSAVWTLNGSSGTIISVTASDTNTVTTTHYWNWGDGTTTSSGVHVYHTYNAPGTYTVCQYVTIPGTNCTDSSCHTVTVTSAGCGNANAAFTISNPSPGVVVLTSTSTGVGTNTLYQWWMDGQIVGQQSANTTFTISNVTSGSHNFCIYIYANSNTFCDSSCRTETITGGNACAGLSAAWNLTSMNGGIVYFTAVDTATGNTHHYWTFSDGGAVTTGVTGTHTFAHSGVYTICQHVYIVGTTCNDSVCQQVTIVLPNPCAGLTAGFSVTTVSGGTIHYAAYDTATGTTHHDWIISDAPNTAYFGVDGSHTFAQSGTYRICQYIYIVGTNCVDSMCQYVTVNTGTCNLHAGMQFTNSANVFTFYGTSSQSNVAWHWVFGDGTDQTTTTGTTTHTYPASTAAHTYTACLIISVPGTICADTFCQTVTVPAVNSIGCHASFAVSNTGSTTVTFASTSTAPGDSIISYYYVLGDGTSSHDATVTHTYNAPGTYYVCLYIATANGCTSSHCDSVHITNSNPCPTNLSAAWRDSIAGGSVHFIANHVLNTANYYWSFGDGTTGSGGDPWHTYASPGLYHVCLYAYIPGTVCIDSFCQNVQVGTTPCSANFTWTINPNGVVTFTNTSVAASSTTQWSWSFGDGSSSTYFSPTHTYVNPGTYYVCLTMVNGTCTSTHCDSIHIGTNVNPCHANYTWSAVNCNTIQFSNGSSGTYTSVEWIFGDNTTSTLQNPTHVYTTPGTYHVYLLISGPNCQSAVAYNIVIQPCAINDTICGVVFDDTNSNGIMDNGEAGIPGAEVHIGNTVVHADSNGEYHAIVPAGTYYVYYNNTSGCIATLPISPNSNGTVNLSYTIQGSAGGTFCGYNFGINCNIVHVCGIVYYDDNGNGQQDSAEAGIANIPILITDANGTVHHAFTNQNGEYCETLPAGTYTITLGTNNYQNCTVTPSSISISATVVGQVYGNNNFGIHCPAGSCDLAIDVTPHTTVTPGFPAWYSIEVCNVGSGVSTGTVNMFFDPSLTFNYASPAQSSFNSSTYTLSWNLNNLAPGACQSFWVNFTANTPLNIGQFVFTLAEVTPDNGCNDVNLNNNVDTVHQDVTASWDPNNKLAYVTNYDDPQYQQVSTVNPDQRIQYVVNFQNTGTIPAINVVVDDLITADLDVNSFQMLGSSHPCVVTRTGNELNFKFSNINLPAQSVDEPGSHGFVKFAINAVNGLPGGHVITDPANIYFDYNAAVPTNDAEVIMLDATGINDVVESSTVVIAPNPMSDYTQVILKGEPVESFRMVVVDMTGRLVADKHSSGNTMMLERNQLAAGIYTYQILINNKPVAHGKLVME